MNKSSFYVNHAGDDSKNMYIRPQYILISRKNEKKNNATKYISTKYSGDERERER